MTAAPVARDPRDVPAWQQRDADWATAWLTARHRAAPELRATFDAAAARGLMLDAAALRMCGVDSATARRELSSARWFRVRRGALCVLSRSAVRSISDDATAQVEALAAVSLRAGTVISHESAATVHALPLLRRPARPSVTRLGRSEGGEGLSSSVVRGARLDPEEVCRWFGAPVTKPARTVLDIARQSGRRAGLVAADAALRDGLCTPAELGATIDGRDHWPGVRTAREVMDLADGRSESALESLTRLLIHDSELPDPELQHWVGTAHGRYRVDMAWPGRRVIVEADGAQKYRGDPDALWREKQRQEHLEQAGWIVVRVTWSDVHIEARRTIARIAAALFQSR